MSMAPGSDPHRKRHKRKHKRAQPAPVDSHPDNTQVATTVVSHQSQSALSYDNNDYVSHTQYRHTYSGQHHDEVTDYNNYQYAHHIDDNFSTAATAGSWGVDDNGTYDTPQYELNMELANTEYQSHATLSAQDIQAMYEKNPKEEADKAIKKFDSDYKRHDSRNGEGSSSTKRH